ncbi:MAG: DNA-directed RNA polymerase subunit alpha C-terminal domain-containing protein [Candidatus Zambryskibacteria bacterium]
MIKSLGRPIGSIGLSKRILTCLDRMGVRTVADLAQKSEMEMCKSLGFNKKSLSMKTLRGVLGSMNLSFGMKIPDYVISEIPVAGLSLKLTQEDIEDLDPKNRKFGNKLAGPDFPYAP